MSADIVTSRLILRSPLVEDTSLLSAFNSRNKNHLAKWENIVDSYTEENDQKRLLDWQKECEEGRSARFFIFIKENPHHLIGMCNFTQVFRGAFQACYLGYKIDHAFEGKGFMFEALQEAISYLFNELHLHRIMANYMPINLKSAHLLNRLGFEIEGYAKHYLLINGKWEDHVLTALSYEKWKS